MTIQTVLIVPAVTNVASQCRIVLAPGIYSNALAAYRSNPGRWQDIGIMNSRGNLVCLEDVGDLRQELKECEPLMAGMTFCVALEAA